MKISQFSIIKHMNVDLFRYKWILQQYSLCQKKRTFNCEFFRGPPGGQGPKIQMVDYDPGSGSET